MNIHTHGQTRAHIDTSHSHIHAKLENEISKEDSVHMLPCVPRDRRMCAGDVSGRTHPAPLPTLTKALAELILMGDWGHKKAGM